MTNHSDRQQASPYSALMCVVMLLSTGLAVKIAAVLHMAQQ